jgi:Ran GTPase-activating protein (RanGAP) involved in mRNA processing and transport
MPLGMLIRPKDDDELAEGCADGVKLNLTKSKLGLCEAMLLAYWLTQSSVMQERLAHVDLRDNNIGDNDEGGAALAAAIEGHGGGIRSLDGITIDDSTTAVELEGRVEGLSLTGMAFVAVKLQKCASITSVNLAGNYIAQYTNKGIEMLGRALEVNKSVKHLNLSKNNLKEEAIVDLLTKVW